MSGVRLVGWVSTAALAVLLVAAPAPAAGSGAGAEAPGLATAQVDVYINVNPSTIQAGYQVGIQASCGEDLNPASVRSDAFGEITLQPKQGGTSLLTGSATVPANTDPGEYQVKLRCANGATATAELYVIDMPRPTRGPDTGGGGMAAAGAAGGGGIPSAPVALATGGVVALAAGLGLLLTGRRGIARGRSVGSGRLEWAGEVGGGRGDRSGGVGLCRRAGRPRR